jgi:hypothetical protein
MSPINALVGSNDLTSDNPTYQELTASGLITTSKPIPSYDLRSAGGEMATHFVEYEKQARSLKRIAGSLGKKSAKYRALVRAAWALGFVTMYHHSEFEKFLDDQKWRELSPQELEHLSMLGLK